MNGGPFFEKELPMPKTDRLIRTRNISRPLIGYALTAAMIVSLGISTSSAAPLQAIPAQNPPQQSAAEQGRLKERQKRVQEADHLQRQIKEMQKRVQELRDSGLAERHLKDMEAKRTDDALIDKLSRDAGLSFAKVSYLSSVDGLSIPAYLFRPATPGGPKAHPALLWVHGGVHGSFASGSIPLIREAVGRGYVVIAPDYRGSTGYGAAFYEAIDYGGYEIDDAMDSVEYLKANVPEVDPDRLGMIGWSHGGFITLHSLIRDQGRILKCGFAGVPVTNLVFRLSYKGPSYEADFVKQKRIGGEVHEKQSLYIERSPVYHVAKIKVPVRVHVATNDQDVNFVEDEMMIYALEYHIPRLAETKIYVDPPGGHSFDRLVNKEKTAPQNTPAQRDSLNLSWAFLEEHLQPYREALKN